MTTLNSAHQAKKQCNWQQLVRTTPGRFIQLFLNLVNNLRGFLGAVTKLKGSVFKNNNQINSIATTRTWVLSTEWTRAQAITGLVSGLKNDGGSCLFQWQRLFLRVRLYRIVSTKMKAMSFCFLQIFEYILSMQFF